MKQPPDCVSKDRTNKPAEESCCKGQDAHAYDWISGNEFRNFVGHFRLSREEDEHGTRYGDRGDDTASQGIATTGSP